MEKNRINKASSSLRALVRDERGMSTVEYVILLAVIVMGAVSIWTEIGGKVVTALGGANTEIQTLPETRGEAQGL